jgi:hypothetical protein
VRALVAPDAIAPCSVVSVGSKIGMIGGIGESVPNGSVLRVVLLGMSMLGVSGPAVSIQGMAGMGVTR